MLRLLASKYGLALHLAVLAAVPVALTPFFPGGEWSTALIPLSLLAAIWLSAAPSLRTGETPYLSRVRVMRTALADPVLWTLALVALFVAVRSANGGISLVYDVEQEVWSVSRPAFPGLPASASHVGFAPSVAAVAALVLVAGVRHGLGASARAWFGLAGSFLTGVAGWCAVAAVFAGHPVCIRLALVDFVSPVFAGSAFSAWFFVGCACGFSALERRWSWASVPFVVALGGNAVAVFAFLPPLWALAVWGAFAAFAAGCLLRLRLVAPPRTFFRGAALLVCGLLSAGAACLSTWPTAVDAAKRTGRSVEKAFSVERADAAEALGGLAHAMWVENPWLGVGEGAFPLQAPFYAAEGDWSALPPKPEVPYNGWFTLLAERGIVGLALLALACGALLGGWGQGLRGALAQLGSECDTRREYWCGLLDPCALAGLFALACAAGDVFFSSAFRVAAFPLSAVVAMTLSGVSFVKVKKG